MKDVQEFVRKRRGPLPEIELKNFDAHHLGLLHKMRFPGAFEIADLAERAGIEHHELVRHADDVKQAIERAIEEALNDRRT